MEFWEKQKNKRDKICMEADWAERHYAYRHQDHVRLGNEEISISSNRQGHVSVSIRVYDENGGYIRDEKKDGFVFGEPLRRLRTEPLSQEVWDAIKPKLLPHIKAPSGVELAEMAEQERREKALERKKFEDQFWNNLGKWLERTA